MKMLTQAYTSTCIINLLQHTTYADGHLSCHHTAVAAACVALTFYTTAFLAACAVATTACSTTCRAAASVAVTIARYVGQSAVSASAACTSGSNTFHSSSFEIVTFSSRW